MTHYIPDRCGVTAQKPYNSFSGQRVHEYLGARVGQRVDVVSRGVPGHSRLAVVAAVVAAQDSQVAIEAHPIDDVSTLITRY